MDILAPHQYWHRTSGTGRDSKHENKNTNLFFRRSGKALQIEEAEDLVCTGIYVLVNSGKSKAMKLTTEHSRNLYRTYILHYNYY